MRYRGCTSIVSFFVLAAFISRKYLLPIVSTLERTLIVPSATMAEGQLEKKARFFIRDSLSSVAENSPRTIGDATESALAEYKHLPSWNCSSCYLRRHASLVLRTACSLACHIDDEASGRPMPFVYRIFQGGHHVFLPSHGHDIETMSPEPSWNPVGGSTEPPIYAARPRL